jgi:putative flavoprotein involved in K+ transport
MLLAFLGRRAMSEEWDGAHRSVVVVGGGQAGLSMSHWLNRAGVDHVVFERELVGYEWRERRWDSFCLVTPNWQCQLPGFGYPGEDPDGFMVR